MLFKLKSGKFLPHVYYTDGDYTTKFKSANMSFGTKPPNLMTANNSGYMTVQFIVT